MRFSSSSRGVGAIEKENGLGIFFMLHRSGSHACELIKLIRSGITKIYETRHAARGFPGRIPQAQAGNCLRGHLDDSGVGALGLRCNSGHRVV